MRVGLERPASRAALAGASILVGAYDQAAIGVAIGPLRVAWHLDPGAVALATSVSAIGMIVGGLSAGLISGFLGRRRLLVADVVLLAVASLGAALAPGLAALVVARWLGGVAVGVSYTVVFVYQRELDEERQGLRWMAATLWSANVGMLCAYAAGAIAGPSVLGARAVLALGAFGAVPLIFVRRRLPETFAGTAHASVLSSFRAVLGRDALAWFLYQISDQGANILLPLIVVDIGAATLRSADGGALAVKAVTIPASLLTVWIVERLGRRQLQVLGFLGRAVAFGFLAVVLWLGLSPIVGVVAFAVGLAAGSVGPDKTTVMGACLDDDPASRAASQGVAQTAGRLGGVVGPIAYVMASSIGGPSLGIGLFALSALAGGLVTLTMRH